MWGKRGLGRAVEGYGGLWRAFLNFFGISIFRVGWALMFHAASIEERKRTFGLMVMDENQSCVGTLSMYDILLFVRPKHVEVMISGRIRP